MSTFFEILDEIPKTNTKPKDDFDYVQFSRCRIRPVMKFWLDMGYSIHGIAENLSIVAEETGDKSAADALDRCWE